MYLLSETHLHSVVIWIFQLKIQGFGEKKGHMHYFLSAGVQCALFQSACQFLEQIVALITFLQ